MSVEDGQQELKEAVIALIDAGCNYRLDELEKIYSSDLSIVIVQQDGATLSFNYQQNMDFFRQLRNSGAPALDKTAIFNLIDIQEQFGYVIVTRHMDLGNGSQKIVFNLMLNKLNGSWQVYREHAVVVS